MKLWERFVDWFITTSGKVHWSPSNLLRPDDLDTIRGMLAKDYYIIVTWRSNHLSAYFTSFANLVLTGHWGRWSHVLMNLEDGVGSDDDFRFVEAIGVGSKLSTFSEVTDVNGIALLRPKRMPIEDWTAVLDKAKTEVGKPYDTLFNLKDDTKVSCVELARDSLQAEPDYAQNFPDLERLIAKGHNLSPDMFYNCTDFEVAFMARR
jgi:hypothetical protein